MRLESLTSAMETDSRLLGHTCNLLDDDVYHVRMVPFADACGGLQRAVRDIAAAGDKQVKLVIQGADVEVDRAVLEGLKDPLLHLVRNAVDHGVESTSQREASGKVAAATVVVAAELRGGQVAVRVEDDGGGLDLESIRQMARKRDIAVPDDPREQARLIFAQGFSTAAMITDISGRGVGLDVVQSQVEQLHGAVDVSHQPGRGTCFTLTVPLTLTTIRSMLVVAAGQTFAVPTSAVRRLVRFSWQDVKSSAGRETLLLGDSPTVVVSLAKTLGLTSPAFAAGNASKGLAIVLVVGHQQVAVLVDEVLAEREVLVKNLGSRIRRLRHFSGCTLLANGQIALVINSANVVRSAIANSAGRSTVQRPTRPRRTERLLLVEDSVTTRVLLRNILVSAGYAVVTAVDGQEAWEMIQDQTFDLVVTDVDMPRMNGFELTALIRGTHTSIEVPVVLVTARGTEQDKQRGTQVGANAYIVKNTFQQQNLLETIAQLV
jgi:two-component system chemotaxis sensor kinase CheA